MCTSFRINAQDKSVVIGRTMEFPNLMDAQISVIPRGYQGTGTGVDGPGKRWTSKYGLVGVDAFGGPAMLTDGMNEKGLYGGLLYMPGFCDYTPADGKAADTLLAITDVAAFVLGTCATVADVKAAMESVTVWPYVLAAFGATPQAHLVIHDSTGASGVVEWVHGEMVFFDNPIGVATNAPHLDWHLTNLRNYLSLSDTNPESIELSGVTLSALGQGQGMYGLPGDSSGPSRFVRAVAYAHTLQPVSTAAELETTALHILNNFDIPFGLIRTGSNPGGDDHTLWTTISNLTDRRYTIRTYNDPIPQTIDLKTIDFTRSAPTQTALPAGSFPTLSV